MHRVVLIITICVLSLSVSKICQAQNTISLNLNVDSSYSRLWQFNECVIAYPLLSFNKLDEVKLSRRLKDSLSILTIAKCPGGIYILFKNLDSNFSTVYMAKDNKCPLNFKDSKVLSLENGERLELNLDNGKYLLYKLSSNQIPEVYPVSKGISDSKIHSHIGLRPYNVYTSNITPDVKLGVWDIDNNQVINKDDIIFLIRPSDGKSLMSIPRHQKAKSVETKAVGLDSSVYYFKVQSLDSITLELVKQEIADIYVSNYIPSSLFFINLNEDTVHLQGLIDNTKYLLVDFWGTWCKPCVADIPKLKEIYSKNEDKLNILSLNSRDYIDKIEEFIHQNGVLWNQGLANTELKGYFGQNGYPDYFLLEPSGRLIGRIALEDLEGYLKAKE